MEIFLLDSNFSRNIVVEGFESFIWTERYSSYGDFEMTLPPTLRNRTLYSIGKMLAHTESDRVMVVDEVLLSEDAEGATTLRVSGSSMEALLDTRALTRLGFDGAGTWKATGSIAGIVRIMVARSLVAATAVNVADVIPTLYATDSSGDTESVTVAAKAQSMYSAVKELCDSAGLGFRIQLMKSTTTFRFNVFRGATRNGVVFSSALDNLSEESMLRSNAKYRNIAYVWAKDATDPQIFAAPGVSVNVSGFARRVLHVDASDINITGQTAAQVTALLRRRGLQALAANKAVAYFDGKISSINPFVYNSDYYIGDTVFMMDENRQKKPVTVSEYIWSYDAEGLRAYPTFAEIE